jgi:hypothetical protein
MIRWAQEFQNQGWARVSYTAGVILACGAMAVLVGLGHQVWAYGRGRSLLSRRQFALRITNGGLLLLAIAMIFVEAVCRIADLRLALAYWAVLCAIPFVVIVLAWNDLRELQRRRHQRQAELYQHLADLQQELRDKRPEKR